MQAIAEEEAEREACGGAVAIAGTTVPAIIRAEAVLELAEDLEVTRRNVAELRRFRDLVEDKQEHRALKEQINKMHRRAQAAEADADRPGRCRDLQQKYDRLLAELGRVKMHNASLIRMLRRDRGPSVFQISVPPPEGAK